MRVEIARGLPEPSVFRAMRAEAGWGALSEERAYLALAGSQFGVVARIEGGVVGFGRVTGDGVVSFWIEDVIVAPEWRGRGVGAEIVRTLVGLIEAQAGPGAMIGLMAAAGREGFYEGLGFAARPAPGYGAAMMRLIGGTG